MKQEYTMGKFSSRNGVGKTDRYTQKHKTGAFLHSIQN